MESDIGPILGDWKYAPGELSVRKYEAATAVQSSKSAWDLGLMQLEWAGVVPTRSVARLPVAAGLLLSKATRVEKSARPGAPFSLSHEGLFRAGSRGHEILLAADRFFLN